MPFHITPGLPNLRYAPQTPPKVQKPGLKAPQAPQDGLPKLESTQDVTPSFSQTLAEMVGEVDASQQHAVEVSEAFARGEQNDIHGTMLAMQKADVTLRFAANVRNRAIEMYREIMRMGA